MTNNLHEPPTPDLDESSNLIEASEIASRMQRFLAALIDILVVVPFTLLMMVVLGYFKPVMVGEQPSMILSIVIGLLSIAFFIAINAKLLRVNGQTMGKRILKIRIAKLDQVSVPDTRQLIKRYGLYFLLGQVPFIGGALSLVNVCLIFGKDKRCGHDLLGDTVVVRTNVIGAC